LELRTGVRVENVDVLKVVLTVGASNDEETAVDYGFGVACTSLWLALRVGKVVTLLPPGGLWVENEEVIEAEGVRAGAAEEKQLILHIAETHACSGGRAVPLHKHLRPYHNVEVKQVEVIEALRPIPTSEDEEVLLNE
jgi:hypothetical protein